MATKSDLIDSFYKEQNELRKSDISDIVTMLFADIANELAQGNRIELRGFGTISTRQRPARQAMDPRSGAKINLPSRRTIYYRMGKKFFEQLNPHLTT